MKKLYIVSKIRTRSWLWLRSWTPYCQIQIVIEESGGNHWMIQVWPKSIPYDYTVEVSNRCKGLDLMDRIPDELWMEVHDIVQETRIKTIPKKKTCKKSKMAVWGGLINSCEKKGSGKQRRKGKNAEFQRIARRDKKAFLSDQCKEIEENNRKGKTRDLFKKLEILREHFLQRWDQ